MTQAIMESVFSGKSRLSVLRCLYYAAQPLTGREIARRSSLSPQQAHIVLKTLVSLGIVELAVAAPSHLFSLNRRHWVITDVVRVVFDAEKNWLDIMLRDLSLGLPPCVKSLVLFGSAARSQLRGGSDIDLLALVGEEKSKNKALAYFSGRSADTLARCHYPLAPVVLTLDEFKSKYKRNDDFARTVLKTGRVISGKLLTEIL